MESLFIENYEFLEFKEEGARLVFSTSRGRLNFNIHEEEGKNNIIKLKYWFALSEVGYLYQIHSSDAIVYDGKIHYGDAIITNKRNTALGVFTADCVPVLIIDRSKQVIAAVHSGWKGTINDICANTISKMKSEYNIKPEDLIAYIGPHNRSCCYEIGKDVEDLFMSNKLYKNINIIEQGNLNLEKCIIAQMINEGVLMENIRTTEICTFCSSDFQMHSYRRDKQACGRMFSFIYLT